MPYDTLLYEKTGQIVKVTLNRPDVLNAISDDMVKEIRLAIDEADADPGVRVVILTGAGRSFSAGYDIKPREDGRPAADPQGFEIGDYIKLWWDRDAYDTDQFTHFWKLGVPVIASVRATALGAGSGTAWPATSPLPPTTPSSANPRSGTSLIRHSC